MPIARSTHYDWLKDPEYSKAFDLAMDDYRDLVREEVHNRALHGTPEEVYFGGSFVGFRYNRSDRLLELEARAHCPEYREKHEISGAGGGPVTFQVITGVPQPEGQ